MRRRWPLFALMAMTWGAADEVPPPSEREPNPEPTPPPRPPNSNGDHRFPKAFKTPEDEQRIADAQARRERRQRRNLERA